VDLVKDDMYKFGQGRARVLEMSGSPQDSFYDSLTRREEGRWKVDDREENGFEKAGEREVMRVGLDRDVSPPYGFQRPRHASNQVAPVRRDLSLHVHGERVGAMSASPPPERPQEYQRERSHYEQEASYQRDRLMYYEAHEELGKLGKLVIIKKRIETLRSDIQEKQVAHNC
jgi:hypothetical protein